MNPENFLTTFSEILWTLWLIQVKGTKTELLQTEISYGNILYSWIDFQKGKALKTVFVHGISPLFIKQGEGRGEGS